MVGVGVCGGGVVCVRGGLGCGRVGCGVFGCVGVGGLFKNTRKTDTDIKKKRHTDAGDLSLTPPPIPARKQAKPASNTGKQHKQATQAKVTGKQRQQAAPASSTSK